MLILQQGHTVKILHIDLQGAVVVYGGAVGPPAYFDQIQGLGVHFDGHLFEGHDGFDGKGYICSPIVVGAFDHHFILWFSGD